MKIFYAKTKKHSFGGIAYKIIIYIFARVTQYAVRTMNPGLEKYFSFLGLINTYLLVNPEKSLERERESLYYIIHYKTRARARHARNIQKYFSQNNTPLPYFFYRKVSSARNPRLRPRSIVICPRPQPPSSLLSLSSQNPPNTPQVPIHLTNNNKPLWQFYSTKSKEHYRAIRW